MDEDTYRQLAKEHKEDRLSEQELDNLQWARDFMNMFENKKGYTASLNRVRQIKYF